VSENEDKQVKAVTLNSDGLSEHPGQLSTRSGGPSDGEAQVDTSAAEAEVAAETAELTAEAQQAADEAEAAQAEAQAEAATEAQAQAEAGAQTEAATEAAAEERSVVVLEAVDARGETEFHAMHGTTEAELALEARLGHGDGTPQEALQWFQQHGFPGLQGLPSWDGDAGRWQFPGALGSGEGGTSTGESGQTGSQTDTGVHTTQGHGTSTDSSGQTGTGTVGTGTVGTGTVGTGTVGTGTGGIGTGGIGAVGTGTVGIGTGVSGTGGTGGLDATAAAIVKAAMDGRPADQRAKSLVWSIIRAYYPTKVGLVRDVTWAFGDPGLTTTALTGPQATGSIAVGQRFLDQIPAGFARRVLQVGHEIEHIEQHRQGMGGPDTARLREFLAFGHEALAAEAPGTGQVPHAMRVALIDAALGSYYCMSAAQQAQNQALKRQLLDERTRQDGIAGNPPTIAPTTCIPSQ
jgi:hypothetical protein